MILTFPKDDRISLLFPKDKALSLYAHYGIYVCKFTVFLNTITSILHVFYIFVHYIHHTFKFFINV